MGKCNLLRMISWFLPVNLLALLMLLVCQSVQYRLSSNTVMAKGCGRPTEKDFRILDVELAGTPTAASPNGTGLKGNIHQSKQSQLLGLTDFYSTKQCRMYSLKFMWGYKSNLTKKDQMRRLACSSSALQTSCHPAPRFWLMSYCPH